MIASAAVFACWMLSLEPAAWATSCCAWSITASPQPVLVGVPRQPGHAVDLPGLRPLVVHPGLHDFGRRKPDCRPPGFVIFIEDLGAAQVHADQRIAADQPGTAAALALANQHVGDGNAAGDQMGKAFEPLDRGPLALDGDRRGRGLETGQDDRHGNHGGCQRQQGEGSWFA